MKCTSKKENKKINWKNKTSKKQTRKIKNDIYTKIEMKNIMFTYIINKSKREKGGNRMKRTKKIIAWATALAMAVVPAATSRADENTDASENAFAKYDETVEISSVKKLGASGLDFPEGDSLEDNVWSRYL